MTSTHFGFKTVDEQEKAKHVRGVFDSVAAKYDVMNDLMSMGLHRVWKHYTTTVADIREGYQVLDIAGGTGDLSMAFAKKVGKTGRVVHTDINEAMLRTGRDRLLDHGVVLPARVRCRKVAFPRQPFRCGERGLWPAQHDAQRLGVERNVSRFKTQRQIAGAGIFKSGQAVRENLRLVLLQYPPKIGEMGGR